MFLKLFLITLIVVALSVMGLCIKIVFSRKKEFPQTHISRNPEMRKRGIKCAQHIDIGCDGVKCRHDCYGCEQREECESETTE